MWYEFCKRIPTWTTTAGAASVAAASSGYTTSDQCGSRPGAADRSGMFKCSSIFGSMLRDPESEESCLDLRNCRLGLFLSLRLATISLAVA